MGAKIEKIIVTTKFFLLYFQKKSPGEISSPLKGGISNISSFASFAPHALKGQKLLAQGIALGYYGRNPVAL